MKHTDIIHISFSPDGEFISFWTRSDVRLVQYRLAHPESPIATFQAVKESLTADCEAEQVPQSCWLIERNAAGWPPIWLTLTTFERKYVTSGNHHYTESAQCALKFHDKESADEYIRHHQIKHVTATEHIFDARALLQEVRP